MRVSVQVWRGVVLLWTLFTVGTFAVISVLILRQPDFPLGITFVETRGLAGLWITVPSFALGTVGLVLLLVRRSKGALLLLVYSAYWTVSMFFAVAEKTRTVIHQPLAVCLTGICTTLPVTYGLFAAFALSVLWYGRQAWARAA